MPHIITVNTPGRALVDITTRIKSLLSASAVTDGVAHLFVQHTSASLVIQENADPDVLSDLIAYFDRLAPEDGPYQHSAEGPDDMPAHIKSALTSTTLTIPFSDRRFLLGTWQGVYLFEHRRTAHQRRIAVSFIGEAYFENQPLGL